MTDQEKPVDFEQALSQLETLIQEMESGELSLEHSLAHFERGLALTRQCQHTLQAAEQKVEMLSQTPSGERLVPFTQQNDESPS